MITWFGKYKKEKGFCLGCVQNPRAKKKMERKRDVKATYREMS